jgi:outer membrane lipase/esterase
MAGTHIVGSGRGSQSSRLDTLSEWYVLDTRDNALLAAALAFIMVVGASLWLAAPVWAQQDLVGVAGDDPVAAEAAAVIAPPGALCPELVGMEGQGQIPQGSATEDLLFRCRELVRAAPDAGQATNVQEGLRAMAQEEVTSLGTMIAELPQDVFADISARLAALRSGIAGASLRRFTLHLDRQNLPGTLVASLLPTAAVSSAVPTTIVRRLGIFATGAISFGDKDMTARESGFDFDTLDVTGGVDYKFTNNLILGVAFGYTASDVDLDMDGGGVDTKGYRVSAYGTYYVADKFFIDAIGSFGWNNYDIDRAIRYSIPRLGAGGTPVDSEILNVDQTAQGDTDGVWYAFSLGIGYEFRAGGFTFTPLGRVNYIKADIDDYQEEIDNTQPGFGLILAFDDQDIESLTTVLGGEVSYALSVPWGVLVPQARFEWEHEFKNDARTLGAHFVFDPTPIDPTPGTPANDTRLDLRTDAPDRDFFNVGIGLTATLQAGFSAFAYYETTLGLQDITVHSVAVGVRKEL